MSDEKASRLIAFAQYLGLFLRIMRHRWFLRALAAFNCLLALAWSKDLSASVLYLNGGLAAAYTILFIIRRACLMRALNWTFRPEAENPAAPYSTRGAWVRPIRTGSSSYW
jgi:hypothetical protein